MLHSLSVVTIVGFISIQGIELPENVQNALDIFTNGGLIKIADAALSSLDIFGDVVQYITKHYPETRCEWLNDDLPDSVRHGWQYKSSDKVFNGNKTNVYCDIEETFDPFCAECIDSSQLPEDLYNDISELASNELSCLARIKWTAWTDYGVVWDQDFLDSLGVLDDDCLWRGITDAIYNLDSSDSYTASFATNAKVSHSKHKAESSFLNIESKRQRRRNCSVPGPVAMVIPNAYAVFNVLGNIFSDLYGTTTAVGCSMGVRVCSGYNSQICVEETFGFTADAQINLFIAESTSFEYQESVDWDSSNVDATFVIEFSIYDNIDVIHGTQLSRETTDELGDWVTAPSVIYNNSGYPVGVVFAGEVYITETDDGEIHVEVQEGVPLGTISTNPIAVAVPGDDLDTFAGMQLFGDKVDLISRNHTSKWEIPLINYIVVIAIAMSLCFMGTKLYEKNLSNVKFLGSEFKPLLE